MNHLKSLYTAGSKSALTLSLIPFLILSGCQKAPDVAQQKAAQPTPTPKPEPQAHVFVDEAMLAKPYAVIGGTVQNVGKERLEKLSVQVELRRRADSGVETREVKVDPADLEPGAQGKFSLKVLSEEWSGSRVVGVKRGAGAEEVAFKSMPGAKRPPERMKDNIIIVKTPSKKKSGGDDFINTPDNPYSVP
ncbi:MAG: hypothetical protein JOZ96_08425 [Acidobacteria bacterium]|nr:hypothetical protein [Acidobacteriota bacterium]